MEEKILDDINLESAVNVDTTTEENIIPEEIPNINSIEWTEFILKKLKPDECYDGQPTADGLRRVAKEYLGIVIESKSNVVQPPNVGNGNHSCIVHDIKIDYFDDVDYLGRLAGKQASYSGVADVFFGNGSDGLFSWRYSSATCQTRAKGRAYKEALNLRNVLTKEELSELPEDESGTDGYIAKTQFYAVNMMCGRLGINAKDYLEHCWKNVNKDEASYNDLSKIPYKTALKALSSLSKLQQNIETIPNYLKGYKADWLQNYV